jgi:two-component system cell cycle sensor histidine kinase PleC
LKTNNAPNGSDDQPSAVGSERVEAELLFDLLRRVRPILVGGVALIAVFVAIFWDRVPRLELILWASLGLLLTLLRLGIAYRFRSRTRDPSERKLWRNAIAIAAAAGGAVWGAASLFLDGFEPERDRFTIILLIVALSGAALIGYANSMIAFHAFLLPALLPYGFVLSTANGRFSLATAAIFLAALALLSAYARRQRRAAAQALALRLSVECLVESLAEARDKAEAASTAKSRFLANVSHELRTPLNAIIGFSEMMTGNVLGPVGNRRYLDYARDIHASGTHLLRLVNEILDVTRLEAGTFELSEEPVDLSALSAEAVSLVRPSAERDRISIERAFLPDLPAISADPLRIKQVLINLLSNAVKFTPEGGRIEISARRVDDGGLAVEISDTGIGIRAENIELVLKPFSRLEAREHTRRPRGLKQDQGLTSAGLGLPLSRMIMEKHGGALVIESRIGKGTKVTLRFPPNRVLDQPRAAALG